MESALMMASEHFLAPCQEFSTMFRPPFLFLAILLIGSVGSLILLPLAVLLGYPLLAIIGLWLLTLAAAGKLERPAQSVLVWLTYLGLILTIHGILMSMDSALAGAPPTPEERARGRAFAYLGGTLAAVSVIAAYLIDGRYRNLKPKSPAPDLLD